jgi:hypothetical protein
VARQSGCQRDHASYYRRLVRPTAVRSDHHQAGVECYPEGYRLTRRQCRNNAALVQAALQSESHAHGAQGVVFLR